MILLISIKTLKEQYLFDDNIDDKYVLSNIQKCQRFIINGLLGDDKYNEILNQVSGNTVTSANSYLITEFLQPIIAYYVMSEVVFSTAYKLKNKGIEFADNDRYSELMSISRKYLLDSEQYQQLLRDYLCDNSIITDNEGKKSVLKTGIYIESSRPKPFWSDDYNCCD